MVDMIAGLFYGAFFAAMLVALRTAGGFEIMVAVGLIMIAINIWHVGRWVKR